MSTSSIAIYLLDISQKYTLYVNYIIFIFGLIGNTLNLLVFTKLKLFRGNCCVFYLIVESHLSNSILLFYFLPQIYQAISGNDPSLKSLFWCKTKTLFGQPSRLIIGSVVCFEAIDQYLSTNHRFYLRKLSTIKLARYLVLITIIIWTLHSIPYIIFYNIIPVYGCIIINQSLKDYYAFVYYIFLNGLIPIFISTLFALLAYKNVRHLIRRQISIRRRRLDQQMTAMIIVRVTIFVIFILPYTIFRVYSLNVIISPVNILLYSISQLISAVVASLLLWAYSCNFYIFLITSSRYRSQVKYFLIKKCWKSIKQIFVSNYNTVHPYNAPSNISLAEQE